MSRKYPSDINREMFEQIRPLLEGVRKQTKPRTVDLYEVFCAVLYLLKSGCQWRMLPAEYPKWSTVHSYFSKWSEPDTDGISTLERALKKCSWRGPYKTGAQVLNELFDRRRTEREEY
jgi:transposase